MRRIQKKRNCILFVSAFMVFSFTTCLPERDNPWDEKANPDSWAPKSLVITINSDNSVTLTWQYDGSPLIDGFNIDRREGEGSWIEGFASLSSNQETFTDNSVTGGKTWAFRVYSNLGSNYSTAIEESIELNIPDGTTSSITYHGYTYQTVYIGGRVWFAENLRTTKYRNGTDIPNVTISSSWASLSTPAYCWYNNEQTTYANNYGALYNWYAVNTGNLCPTGWHVPTDAEWTALTDYVGGASIAGTKLKATSGWNSGGNGTNEYGFSTLPGGSRGDFYGAFNDVGGCGGWWSSTEDATTPAWYRLVDYDYEGVYRYSFSKRYGFSVRCIKDRD
jgi:uncharacterized protein (TIGR02145 family)